MLTMRSYALLYLVIYGTFGAVLSALDWAGVPMPQNNVSALAPMLVASVLTGWYFARQRGTMPTTLERKGYARIALALTLASSIGVSIVTHGLEATVRALLMPDSAGMLLMAIMAMVATAVYWLLRLSFVGGAFLRQRQQAAPGVNTAGLA